MEEVCVLAIQRFHAQCDEQHDGLRRDSAPGNPDVIGLVIRLYATSYISAAEHGLRFVLVVTTAFVSRVIGAVARFKVVQAPL